MANFFIDEHKTKTCNKKGTRTLIYYPDFRITNIQKERKERKKRKKKNCIHNQSTIHLF
jgi:hypothetical protein